MLNDNSNHKYYFNSLSKFIFLFITCFYQSGQAFCLPPTNIIEAYDSELIKEEQKLNQSNTESSKKNIDDQVAAVETFIKKRINLVSNPATQEGVAEEISSGGAEIPDLFRNQTDILSRQEIISTIMTAVQPPLRWAISSNQCNPSYWPSQFYCGGCISYIPYTSICAIYGITMATYTRLPTQLITVSTDSQSSPLTPTVLKELSAKSTVGEDLPGVTDKAAQVARSIGVKKRCLKKQMSQRAEQILISRAMGTKIEVTPIDIVRQELEACVKNDRYDNQAVLKPSEINASINVTPEQRNRLVNNVTNSIVAEKTGHRSFIYSIAPFVPARQLYKNIQENAVYLNYRVFITITGQVITNVAMDPSLPFVIKPPYTMIPETNLDAALGNPNPNTDLFASVSHVMNDGQSPAYFHLDNQNNLRSDIYSNPGNQTADDTQKFSKFNLFKDPRDSGTLIPAVPGLRTPDISLGMLKEGNFAEIVYGIDPLLAPQRKKIADQIRFDPCSRAGASSVSLIRRQSNIYNSKMMSAFMKQANDQIKIFNFGIPDNFGLGSLINKGSESWSKSVEDFLSNQQNTLEKQCSPVTGAADGFPSEQTKGTSRMSASSKVVRHEIPYIIQAGKKNYKINIPPSAGTSDGVQMGFATLGGNAGQLETLLNQINTNITFYDYLENGYFGDKTQYLGIDLEKLNAPFPFDYSKDCRNSDISDQDAKDESKVFPGNEAKLYVHNTAFMRCPAWDPLGKGSKFNGLPVGELLSLFLSIVSPGGEPGIEDFSERVY
jgi:hypothetical protein